MPDKLFTIELTYEDTWNLKALLCKPINVEDPTHEDPVDYITRNNMLKKLDAIISQGDPKSL